MSSPAFSDASIAASIERVHRSPLEPHFGTPSPSPYQIQFPQYSFNSRQQQQNSFEIDSVFLSPRPSPIRIPSPPRVAPLRTPLSQFETRFTSLSPTERTPVFTDGGGSTASLGPKLIQIPNSMHDLLNFPQNPPGFVYRQPSNLQNNISTVKEEFDGDEIEEIIRSNPNAQESWLIQYRSSSPSNSSTHSSSSQSSREESTSVHDIFRRPAFDFNSPEMLLLHFDKHTCGIMSVKDGLTENPWRTLIWPLATNSPALYHAIASMTAFHMSRERSSLRVEGIEHMRRSATYLAQDFESGLIRNDAALATTLVLAFSEAFDRHTSNGAEHLRGAKELVNQALTRYQTSESSSEGRQMFTFLYNVWVYLDVLARLTSEDDEDETPVSHGPLAYTSQVDPLLGCAASLFPLIGRVASLVQKVRKTEKNSFGIISQAMEIKTQLEDWAPEAYYENPEDPLLEVAHCISTAEAYRWATLLYLHQAVPELPSPTAHELAEKVMVLLATVPSKSGSCIVHIYPLLAAGCEAIGKDERDWVNNRWQNMCARMWIGNVDKSWEVVKEVWDRRDRFEWEQHQARLASPQIGDFYGWPTGALSKDSATVPKHQAITNLDPGCSQQPRVGKRRNTAGVYEKGQPEYEVTVRGKLHWISVMKDRNWEGKLNTPSS